MESSLYRLPKNYKLDDVDIFAYRGVVYRIDGYKSIDIKQLSVNDWIYIYTPMLAIFFHYLSKETKVFECANVSDKLQKSVSLLKDIFAKKAIMDNFLKILKKLKVIDSIGKFKRKASIYNLVEIFLLLYLFNSDGLKKKLKFLTETIFTVKNKGSETSLTNVNGVESYGKMKIVEKIDVEKWKADLKRSRIPISN